MQDLDQIADGLLPHVEGVLAGAAGAHVLAVAGEAALLPRGSGRKMMRNDDEPVSSFFQYFNSA